jgi:histidine triad (HIT) family protein
MDDCIFCKIAKGEISSEKIYENANFFSIPDANQKIEGHSLVISKNHFESILDLPSNIGEDLADCIKETSKILIEKFGSEGINVVQNNFEAAGQVVKHIHFHILPRKKGDKIPHVY